MTPPRLLIVGRQPEIMRRVAALVDGAGYASVPALTDDEALAHMRDGDVDALLIGGGVETGARSALRAAFERERPGRPVIEHFGGPQGLLEHLAAIVPVR